MISKNDLYDLTYIFIIIRNNIRDSTNKAVLIQLISECSDINFKENNWVRHAIASAEGIDAKRWSFAYHDNIYVNNAIMKDYRINSMILSILVELYELLNKNAFEQAYDLADSFHCLPQIIADNNFTIPKNFWKTYVKVYRKKWNNAFLLEEQKNIGAGGWLA